MKERLERAASASPASSVVLDPGVEAEIGVLPVRGLRSRWASGCPGSSRWMTTPTARAIGPNLGATRHSASDEREPRE